MPVVAAGVAFEAQGVVKVQKASTFICLCRIRTTLLYLLDKGLGMLCKWFFLGQVYEHVDIVLVHCF